MIKKIRSMFRTSSSALGLEITDTCMKLVNLTAGDGNNYARLHDSFIERLPAGVVEEGKIVDFPRAILTLQQIVARIRRKTRIAHLVLPSSLIMVRYLKLPDLPIKELTKVVDFEIKHNMHLPFDEPIYDFIKLSGDDDVKIKPRRKPKQVARGVEEAMAEAAAAGQNGTARDMFGDFESSKPEVADAAGFASPQCDVLLVAAAKELVDDYTYLAESAGLKLLSLEIKALSLYRLIENFRPIDPLGTFLIIDVNELASDLSIYHDGQLKLTCGVNVDFSTKAAEQKEDNLVFFQFADADEDSAFQNALNELGHELERLLNFYRYSLNNRNQQFSGIVMTGDVEWLDDISHHLEERLNLKVQLIDNSFLNMKRRIYDDIPLAALSVPIGLSLRGNRR